jgi:hypothetical protein
MQLQADTPIVCLFLQEQNSTDCNDEWMIVKAFSVFEFPLLEEGSLRPISPTHTNEITINRNDPTL